MTEIGAATFTNPDAYSASIGAATVELFVTSGGDFNGRLMQLNLDRLLVLQAQENLSRIGFVTLPPSQAIVSFPASRETAMSYCGVRLRFGDIVFHGLGEQAHQRIEGGGRWGLLSLPAEQLAACSKALTGQSIRPPSDGRVMRSSFGAARAFLELHAKVCRLADTGRGLIGSAAVGRAIEEELIHALVDCLIAANAAGNPRRKRKHAEIMVRFEQALATKDTPRLSLSQLCAAIGVPERTLRLCCAEFLGMGPTRYNLVRRLNRARAALRRADPKRASVGEIARDHHFLELGRFAFAYRAVFGEMPSSTLRRARNKAD
jgi:AraC-like DNA-binding protein